MILLGNCLDELKKLDDCSVHAIVTDPPYGLSFMGKKWDYDVPSVDIWREALRVLKHGGHLLSFGGTRTYHRMVVNVEDAGFEIRDQIQWIYGSGFPKSLNLKDEWQGWGTALKPANEPIVLARKPLEKGMTVAENVLKWGCGAINIDGSRIDGFKAQGKQADFKKMRKDTKGFGWHGEKSIKTDKSNNQTEGRWPANVLFDEQAAFMLDEQSGIEASRFFYCAKVSKSERNAGLEEMPTKTWKDQGFRDNDSTHLSPRAGAGRTSANQNHHPTVKPIKLMEYLIALITPPNGVVLDPFMGSGSTGVATKNLGFNFIGIELNEEYFEIAKERINANLKLI